MTGKAVTMGPKRPNGQVAAMGLLGIFILYEDSNTCWNVLAPVFKGDHCLTAILSSFYLLNPLEQAGFFLYVMAATVSFSTLVWAIFSISHHHARKTKYVMAKFLVARKRRHRAKTSKVNAPKKLEKDDKPEQ